MLDLTGAFALLLKARLIGRANLHAEDLRFLQVNSRIVSLVSALEQWEVGTEASRDLAAQYAGAQLRVVSRIVES